MAIHFFSVHILCKFVFLGLKMFFCEICCYLKYIYISIYLRKLLTTFIILITIYIVKIKRFKWQFCICIEISILHLSKIYISVKKRTHIITTITHLIIYRNYYGHCRHFTSLHFISSLQLSNSQDVFYYCIA